MNLTYWDDWVGVRCDRGRYSVHNIIVKYSAWMYTITGQTSNFCDRCVPAILNNFKIGKTLEAIYLPMTKLYRKRQGFSCACKYARNRLIYNSVGIVVMRERIHISYNANKFMIAEYFWSVLLSFGGEFKRKVSKL